MAQLSHEAVLVVIGLLHAIPRNTMRGVPILVWACFPIWVGAMDFSGTWFGSWRHQGEDRGACLYLLQGESETTGQIAFDHDTRFAEITIKKPAGNTLEFTIVDKDQGEIQVQLKESDTPGVATMLVGEAIMGGQSDAISLRKNRTPSTYYRYGKGRFQLVPLTKAEPFYTTEARAAKVQGTVEVMVPIESSGMVGSNVQVIRGLGFGLDEEAVKAAKKWRFTPPREDCKADSIHRMIHVQFNIFAR